MSTPGAAPTSSASVHADCGAPLPNWPPFGPILSIRDDDADKLASLYRSEFDELKCEGCGRGLLPLPSLVVSFDDYALEYLYCGPATRGYPDVIRNLQADALAKGNIVLTGYSSPEELRVAAWKVLETRAAAFFEALHTVLTDAPGYARVWSYWRISLADLAPRLFR